MNQSKRRTVFTFLYAQLSIVCLFGFVTVFTLIRLFDVRDDLYIITQTAMPEITKSTSFNTKIQILATQTSMLASADNEPTRRLIMQQIEGLMINLNATFENNSDDDQRIANQLDAINAEIKELDTLVEQKIELQKEFSDYAKSFTETVFASYMNINASNSDAQVTKGLFDIILLVMQLEDETRLSSVRQIEERLGKASQTALSFSYPEQDSSVKLNLLNELLQFDRLIEVKVNSLLITGRVRGRDSFLRNLLSDLSSNLEYQTELINQNILNLASNTSNQVARQTKIAIMLGAVTILITLFIIIFLYRRFVLRLMLLTKQVDAAAESGKGSVSIDGDDEIAHLASIFSDYIKKSRKQEKVLLNLSMTDPLTGIPNRRAFEIKLIDAVGQARRSRSSLTILLADVDFFKAYNDHYGHTEGDNCLKLVAKQLQATVVRNTDFCARYGGEEFICILPDTQPEGAKIKAEQIHTAIKQLDVVHAFSTVNEHLTLSLGVATFSFATVNDWSLSTIIEQADKALYEAKNSGRNKSCFSVLS